MVHTLLHHRVLFLYILSRVFIFNFLILQLAHEFNCFIHEFFPNLQYNICILKLYYDKRRVLFTSQEFYFVISEFSFLNWFQHASFIFFFLVDKFYFRNSESFGSTRHIFCRSHCHFLFIIFASFIFSGSFIFNFS